MELILRHSNIDAEGMHFKMRVENEVTMLNLASAALSHIKPAVIPRVFGWGIASSKHTGWILEELVPGLPVAESFETTMTLDQKKEILAQMAEILKAQQDYPLPDSIGGWGGVTFDASESIVSGPMTSVGAGPWLFFEGFFRDCLETALTEADGSPILQSWWANGVRACGWFHQIWSAGAISPFRVEAR